MTTLAADLLIADYILVLDHLLQNPNSDYSAMPAQTRDVILTSVAQYDFAPLDALTSMVAFVCWSLDDHQQHRPLTKEERHVYAAALRLSDAIHYQRVTYRPHHLRSDGTTD